MFQPNVRVCRFMAIGVIIFIIFSTGCASTGKMQVQKPLTASIDNYKILAVSVFSQGTDNSASNSDLAIEEQLAGSVISKLRDKNLFKKVYSTSASVEKKSDLILTVNLTKTTKVSTVSRAWLGILAGRGVVEGNVEMTDAKNGEVLSKATVYGKTSAGMPLGMDGTTFQAVERMAEQIVNFVVQNKK